MLAQPGSVKSSSVGSARSFSSASACVAASMVAVMSYSKMNRSIRFLCASPARLHSRKRGQRTLTVFQSNCEGRGGE